MKHKIPDIVSGYELDEGCEWGLFDVVIPQQCINYVHNPAMARGWISGYVGVDCTVSITTDYQRRGLYSLKVVPDGGATAKAYYYLGGDETPEGGHRAHFSCDILGPAGASFFMYVTNALGVVRSERVKFKTTGEWMRPSVSFMSTNELLLLYVEKESTQDLEPFYLDGFQYEENTSGATTYCDGDQEDFLVNRSDYAWYGERSWSKSCRLGKSRSGGYRVNLKKLGFVLTGIVGLGMNPVEPVALDLYSGGAMYQKSKDLQREFSLVGTIYGKSRSEIMAKKGKLIRALSSKSYYPDQPILLYYCRKDERGFSTSKEYTIKCVYLEGLEGVTDNNNAEQLNIRFKLFDPYITTPGNLGYAIKTKDIVEDVIGVVRRNALPVTPNPPATRRWETLGSGIVSGTYSGYKNQFNKVVQGQATGKIYVFGRTLEFPDDTTGVGAGVWDGNTWQTFDPAFDDVAITDEFIVDGDISPDETVWVIRTGYKVGINVPSLQYQAISYWDVAQAKFIDVYTQEDVDLDDDMFHYSMDAIAFDRMKNSSSTGLFILGMVEDRDYQVYYYNLLTGVMSKFGNNTTFQPGPTDTIDSVNPLYNAVMGFNNAENSVYVSGDVDNYKPYTQIYSRNFPAHELVPTTRIFKVMSTSTDWSFIGDVYISGESGEADVSARHPTVTGDGRLFMGGNAYYAGGWEETFIRYFNRFGEEIYFYFHAAAVFDGYVWSSVPILEDMFTSDDNNIGTPMQEPKAEMYGFYETPTGELMAYGKFVSPKYGVLNGVCYFGNNYIRPIGYTSTGTAPISKVFIDWSDRLYLFFTDTTAHDDVVECNTNQIYSYSDAFSYPIVEMRGPMKLDYLFEGSIGTGFVFDNLYLLATEYAALITSQFGVKFYSAWRGNMISYIMDSSDFNYRINPGWNIPQVYGEVVSYESLDADNRLSGWDYIYVPPEATAEGLIYFKITVAGANLAVNLYRDPGMALLVAHTNTFTTIGVKTLIADNNSGIVGNITVDSLPPSEYTGHVVFGYVALLWKEQYTAITEDIPSVSMYDRSNNTILNPFGIDTIV